MEYSVRKREDIRAVVVEAAGMISTDMAGRMVMAIGSALRSSGFKRCFFDLSETTVDPQQSMLEMVMFVEAFKNAGITSVVRMAAYYTFDPKPRLFLAEC